ncbi:MAG: hypothetical protein H6732_10085 [Alphaproteobacteria bacterium]|nr:hypothetical protein [Alphaproteobacteria bacterium]
MRQVRPWVCLVLSTACDPGGAELPPVPLVEPEPPACGADALPFDGGCIARDAERFSYTSEQRVVRLRPREVAGRTWWVADVVGDEPELAEVCAAVGGAPYVPRTRRDWSAGVHFASVTRVSVSSPGTVVGARVDLATAQVVTDAGEVMLGWLPARPPHPGADDSLETELQEMLARVASGEDADGRRICLRVDRDGAMRLTLCSTDGYTLVCADPATEVP